MLTKKQKQETIGSAVEQLRQSQSLILIDFEKLSAADLRQLRIILHALGAKLKVIKKRLLKIVFSRNQITIDPAQFPGQVGTIFLVTDLYGGAGKIYNFIKNLAKEKKELKILTAYDLQTNQLLTPEEFNNIAKLPSREILLAQIALLLTMPLKKIMLAINGRIQQLETK